MRGVLTHVERTLADYPPPTPQPTPCRLWQGRTSPKGYGTRRDMKPMHVWVWEQVNGPVPTGKQINHRCDNPPCYRYDHLYLGTQAENMADMVARGRSKKGERHHGAKLSEADVLAILASTEHPSVLGERYGVHRSTIVRIKRGQRWSHLRKEHP